MRAGHPTPKLTWKDKKKDLTKQKNQRTTTQQPNLDHLTSWHRPNTRGCAPVKHANMSEGSNGIAHPSKNNCLSDLSPCKEHNSLVSASPHNPKLKYLTVGGNLISPVIKFGQFTISKVFRLENKQIESSGRHDRITHCWMENSSKAGREYPCHKVAKFGHLEIVNFERDRLGLNDNDELELDVTENVGSGIAWKPAL
jgi:hypothetical protein